MDVKEMREWGRKNSNADVVADAVHAGRWHFLAGWVCGNFPGVRVSFAWCEDQINLHACQDLKDCPFAWSDGSWRMWWKVRVEESGLLPPGCKADSIEHATGTLHSGGTWYSTPEELARLKTEEAVRVATVATPGIERTMTMPEPIDATAARVVFDSRRKTKPGKFDEHGAPVG